MTAQPILYDPALERPEKDESETIAELLETMKSIRETTYGDSGHAMRSVHVKSHGLLRGTLTIKDDLPETLRQGLFAQAATYPLLMRFSTSPGDMLPDSVSTPRGCALKIVGVPGKRLIGSENDVTQDFLLVNGDKVFQTGTLKGFLQSLKPLAALTDKFEGAKVAASAVLRGVEKMLEAAGTSSAKIKNMGGAPENHLLGETYFSQAPHRFGRYMAKIALVPVSPELTALTGVKLDITGNPLAMREATLAHFREHGGTWELRVQLNTNLEKMPIEDSSVEWPEELSPYVAVATVTIPPQLAWSEQRSVAMDDGMSFSPWHGLVAHQPIGSLMRARKSAYDMSARYRAARNGTPVREPRSLDDLPL